MSDSICFSAKPNCYAVIWSYGEICVGSNCCGQFGKGLKMWRARLEYNQSLLDDSMNFTDYIRGWEEIQKKNIKENIKYEKAQIKKCKRMIKYFISKEESK